MLDINEIKKDLYKSKNMAKFSHYQSGDLFYTVELADGKYQFPIAVVEDGPVSVREETPVDEEGNEILTRTGMTVVTHTKVLSEDLGITPFGAEVRGSELIRWIQKAIKNESFIKVG